MILINYDILKYIVHYSITFSNKYNHINVDITIELLDNSIENMAMTILVILSDFKQIYSI